MVDGTGSPWVHGRFVPGPAYDDGVRALFARGLTRSSAPAAM
ncbi:hypothetical protein [Streptomyces sp. NPDC008125]